MAKLILTTAEGQQFIDLRPTNSLGRHPNNTIQLLDKIVSKEHCILEQREGQFVLRDLGSLNGTYVNSDRVRGEIYLKHGDEIALGSTRARFDDESGTAFAPPPIGPGAVQHAATGGSSWPAVSTAPRAQPASAQAVSPSAGRVPVVGSHDSSSRPPHPHGSPAIEPTPIHRPAGATRVDVLDAARAIGTQIAAQTKGFVPFEAVGHDPQQLRLDYERLRISWELTRDIGLERDLDQLLDKILLAIFKFTKADRGVILLRETDGNLQPRAARRRDGSDSPIQVSSTILNHVIRERAGVLTHDASLDFAASKGKSMILNRISSAMVVPFLHDNEKEVLGVLWLDSEALAQFQPKDLEVITSVAGQASMFIENTILAKKVEQEIVLRERFMRLVAPNVAEQMVSGKLEVKKGGQLVSELNVFNSDIRGFTAMSEGTSAETLVEMLNEYFELMVETVFKYEGTLDKFMGDGLMAIFGAPENDPYQEEHALKAAIEMQQELAKLQVRWEAEGIQIRIGVGIHSGPAIVGTIGSSRRMEYTAIGDTVNVASRLQTATKELGASILVSEHTYYGAKGAFPFRNMGTITVRGREEPLTVYALDIAAPSPELAVVQETAPVA